MRCFWNWTTFPGSTSWKGWPLSDVNTEALSLTSIWHCRGVSVNFKKPKAKLCHFLTASVTSATLISESSPSSPALLPLWGSPQFLSHSLKYSLQRLTITSVKVSNTLSPLYTHWKGGCLPFCSYLTVSQKWPRQTTPTSKFLLHILQGPRSNCPFCTCQLPPDFHNLTKPNRTPSSAVSHTCIWS